MRANVGGDLIHKVRLSKKTGKEGRNNSKIELYWYKYKHLLHCNTIKQRNKKGLVLI